MKKNLISSVLMLLFVSTITFSQTTYFPDISSPLNDEVVSYKLKIPIDFDDYVEGLTPNKHYYFDIYVNNSLVSQQTTTPYTLVAPPTGQYTVTIVFMCRNLTSDPFYIGGSATVTFYVAPTISISSDFLDDVTFPIGTILTFTPNVFPSSIMTISWERYSPVSNTWVSIVGNHFCSLTVSEVGMNKVRAKICVNGILLSTSNEIVIYVQ